MNRLIGMFVAFIGFLLLSIASRTEDTTTFQVCVIFGIPAVIFGLKWLIW